MTEILHLLNPAFAWGLAAGIWLSLFVLVIAYAAVNRRSATARVDAMSDQYLDTVG